MCTTSIDDSRVSYVGGRVDANRARRHLRDGNNIGEFAHGHPMMVGDDLALDHRDHRITSAKAEETDEEKGIEELEVNHNKEIDSSTIPHPMRRDWLRLRLAVMSRILRVNPPFSLVRGVGSEAY